MTATPKVLVGGYTCIFVYHNRPPESIIPHRVNRLETQAGTYIKEFVHGDFGRTRPSLAELLGVDHGEVDILELDVENVDMVWPPVLENPVKFR
uniref:tRNA pseudouridine(55) synthase n=1 Tax=Caenorhabditis japonica TaxID=281687 RepID=A0A8R1EGU7_CAEJA